MPKKQIAVVGGGAAGLAAAISAAREGCSVSIFEAAPRVGKSILQTGDGRCNIANTATDAALYRNADFVRAAFDACSPGEAIAFLESCGLLLREEAQGRLYPQTNKASSVVDALRLALGAGVQECCEAGLEGLEQQGSGWRLRLADGSSRSFAAVVLASGPAAPAYLPNSVRWQPFEPLLGPLATETKDLKGLDKLRVKCAISAEGQREEGEITFRNYGISGIAVFNISRFVKEGSMLCLDFLPGASEEQSLAFLRRRLQMLQSESWLDFTCGMLLPLLARAVLRKAGLAPESKPGQGQLASFNRSLRSFELRCKGIGEARLCQVHRGGIRIDQVDAASMQLRGLLGLFAAGELLDVDGPCGGYNLHWAWVSGMLAGRAAAGD